MLVSQTDASSGSLLSYASGRFTAQFWTIGHPVPFLVRELDPEDVKALRDELAEQLGGPSTGLDEVPLRAFMAAADAYTASRSNRFSEATFGTISGEAPGELLGELSWGGGAVGSVLASKHGVSVQSHIPPQPASDAVRLRGAELRSLISALTPGPGSPAQDRDPLWSELRGFAELALAARDSRPFW